MQGTGVLDLHTAFTDVDEVAAALSTALLQQEQPPLR
jgi:hypothetical protein